MNVSPKSQLKFKRKDVRNTMSEWTGPTGNEHNNSIVTFFSK